MQVNEGEAAAYVSSLAQKYDTVGRTRGFRTSYGTTVDVNGGTYGWKFSLSGSMDIDSGNLIGNNKGVMLTISKLWKVL
jgi:adenylosuccinate synthase